VLEAQGLGVASGFVQRPGVGVVHLDERADADSDDAGSHSLGGAAVVGVEQGGVGVEGDAVGDEQPCLDLEQPVHLLRLLLAADGLQVLTGLDDVLRLGNVAHHLGVVGDCGADLSQGGFGARLAFQQQRVAGVCCQPGVVEPQGGCRVTAAPGELAEVVLREGGVGR